MRSKPTLRTEHLLELTRDGLLVLDAGRVVEANAAARALLGPNPVAPDKWSVDPAWREAIASRRGEVDLTLPSGTPVVARLTPLPDGSAMLELRDNSHLRALETRLAHDDQMRAIGQLASGIAHDMNNVLTVVSSIGSVMRSEMRDAGPTVLEDIDDILAASRAGQDLTRNLLGFARNRGAVIEHLDAGAIAEEVVDLARRTAPKDSVIQVAAMRDVVLEADRSRFSQAVMNLVLNALDATGEHGRVHVLVERVWRSADPTRPETRPGGTYVHVRVADNGPGMDDATRAKCFEPFYTTKPPGKGTGLGLSMVRDAAERHRGWVELESAAGSGTAIDMYLPGIPERSPTPPPINAPRNRTPIPAPGEGMNRGRVLVVDDEKPIRRVTRRLLRRLGFDAVSAPDGLTAIDMVSRAPESFTAVILDVVMPVMDGPEVFRRLREIRDDLHVLVCSGHVDLECGELFQRAHRTRFLPKPFDMDSLGAALDALLDE